MFLALGPCLSGADDLYSPLISCCSNRLSCSCSEKGSQEPLAFEHRTPLLGNNQWSDWNPCCNLVPCPCSHLQASLFSPELALDFLLTVTSSRSWLKVAILESISWPFQVGLGAPALWFHSSYPACSAHTASIHSDPGETTEVARQLECLLGGKRGQYVWLDTRVGSEE